MNGSPFSENSALWRWLTAFFLLALIIEACSSVSTPQKKQLTVQEQAKQSEELDERLSERLQSGLKLERDPILERYFKKISMRLAAMPLAPKPTPTPSPDISPYPGVDDEPASKTSPTPSPSPSPSSTPPPSEYQVRILADRSVGSGRTWRDLSYPPDLVFLSADRLRATGFENELAALIALEIAHIQHGDVISNLRSDPDWASWAKIGNGADFISANDDLLDYTYSQWAGAVDRAIEILYGSGYDPRGLIVVLGSYKENLPHSPLTAKQIDKLIAQARQTLATYTPLRNPIVQTQEFLLMKKRIRKL